MKSTYPYVITIAAIMFASSNVLAQAPERHGPGGEGPPPNPVMEALDKNKDHKINSDEIENAVSSLKSLDADGDGELSGNELRPDRDRPRPRSNNANNGAQRRPQGRRPTGPNPAEIMNHAFQFDANSDGMLSRQEFQLFVQEMGSRGKGRPDGRPPRGERGLGQQRPDRQRR